MSLIGHQARWRALARAFQNNQSPQTLLISGPPNVGKTTFVWRYAQLLLCPHIETDSEGLPAPCGQCATCHQVQIGTYPDFRVFRPRISSDNKEDAPEELDSSVFAVGLARTAGDEALKKPISGARKVLVLSQFDRANDEAENALLKTLEEPPASVKLILTTDNVRQLRATVLSRCWHLALSPVSDEEISRWLSQRYPNAGTSALVSALSSAYGRPGAAAREIERLQAGNAETRPRAEVTAQILAKLDTFGPVGALGLADEATKWAKSWWEEDVGDAGDAKRVGAKGNRAALARFLEELALAGHQKWVRGAGGAVDSHNAARLDLIRKTRQHILRNANDSLALCVLFSRLIALRATPPKSANGVK